MGEHSESIPRMIERAVLVQSMRKRHGERKGVEQKKHAWKAQIRAKHIYVLTHMCECMYINIALVCTTKCVGFLGGCTYPIHSSTGAHVHLHTVAFKCAHAHVYTTWFQTTHTHMPHTHIHTHTDYQSLHARLTMICIDTCLQPKTKSTLTCASKLERNLGGKWCVCVCVCVCARARVRTCVYSRAYVYFYKYKNVDFVTYMCVHIAYMCVHKHLICN